MCLDTLYNKKEIEKLPKTITAYKVIHLSTGAYYPLFFEEKEVFTNGMNKADTTKTIYIDTKNNIKYQSGFHFFLNEKDAKEYVFEKTYGDVIISCQLNKEDVTAIGKQIVYHAGEKNWDEVDVIVATKAIFNLPKEKEKSCV